MVGRICFGLNMEGLYDMKNKHKTLMIVSGLTAAGAAVIGAASHAMTKFMMGMALDRNQPKSMIYNGKIRQSLRGAPYLQEFLDALDEAAKKLENSDCEKVEITSSDGIQLVGHLHMCETPKRIIIAMHGWRSSWSQDFGLISDFWNENDCIVLYAEQRGQNNSGGDYMGFGLLERYDCLDWIHWANERFGMNIPIYLAGVSMGATTVLMTAGLDLPDNVRGIAADCGFTSAQAIWQHVANNNLHISYGLRRAAASDLCRKKIQVGPDEYSTLEALRNCKVPVLLVHGTEDRFVPIEMTYENYQACAAPKTLLVVPGADHGMSYYVDREKYEKTAKEFWNSAES